MPTKTRRFRFSIPSQTARQFVNLHGTCDAGLDDSLVISAIRHGVHEWQDGHFDSEIPFNWENLDEMLEQHPDLLPAIGHHGVQTLTVKYLIVERPYDDLIKAHQRI
jgi:hypothetical protein